MPKENTHLWFAQTLLSATETADGLKLLRDKPLFFFLGSVIPDAFYYHPRPWTWRMPRVLHGSDSEWKNKTPAWLVGRAGRSESPADKAFALGYLSHLALDRIFHPVIHVLSGKREGQAASYQIAAKHRLVETALDQIVNQRCLFHRIIQPRIGDHVQPLQALAVEVGLGSKDVRQALTIQHLANRLILGRGAHKILAFLDRLPLLDLSILRNLCYAQLDQEPAFTEGASVVNSGDPGADKALVAVRRINWLRLFAKSKADALRMFRVCTAYWRGEMSADALEEMLPGRACD